MMKSLGVCLIFPCCLVFAQEAPSCKDQAKTPLEDLYCDIRVQSPSTPLPNLKEFRENPEKTQQLLLKRPAKKLGLSMPKLKTTTKPKTYKGNVVPEHIEDSTSKRYNSASGGLSEFCLLAKTSVSCDSLVFRLQNNIPNQELAEGALALDSEVTFPPFIGDKNINTDVIPYLDQTYLLYIENMLKIGLGASTMSFTKFYHTFMEVESKKVNFAARMAQMFIYLKKDKSSIGVKTRFNELIPSSLENCSALSKKIIVCDNVKQNWVYLQI